MAALLVGMAVMAVFLSMVLPAWRTAAQREKETELIFRGQQYARAITLFQRKYANAFPPNVDILLAEHFLRKKYKDPMTPDGEFQVLYANQQAPAQPNAGGANPGGVNSGGTVPQQGQPVRPTTQVTAGANLGPGGIIGVTSKSSATSLRVYNGRDKYNEWAFVASQATNRVSAPNGSQTPTGGLDQPGGAVGGRGGQPQLPGGGRGNQPGGRGQNPNQPGPFGRSGAGAPPPGAPFGGGGFGSGPGRGR